MNGIVDPDGKALLRIAIIGHPNIVPDLDVWIDTGFTGELFFPLPVIRQLGLRKGSSAHAILADGSQTVLDTYTCRIHWFNGERTVEVIANDGDEPLLGVGLLLGCELRVDYTNRTLSLLPSAPISP